MRFPLIPTIHTGVALAGPLYLRVPSHVERYNEEDNANSYTDSVLFLLLSLLIIAASLYLPEHLSIIASRIFYYYSGNENAHSLAQKAGEPAQIYGAGLAGNGRAFVEP